MIESAFIYLLLILGVAIGWTLGYRYANQSQSVSPTDWIPSIDALLSQSNDESIAKLLEVRNIDDDSIDLFLKLGRSLRDKGEIDRATHLHQKLFARPDLNKSTLQYIQLELAIDYERAGLLDRAEKLFRELLDVKGHIHDKAAGHLIALLEDEGEWQAILDLHLSKKLPSTSKTALQVSHACCELAEKELKKKDFSQTQKYSNQALKINAKCARAYVLLGDIAFDQQEYREAIRCYLKSAELDHQSVVRILEKLIVAFHSLDDFQGLQKHLKVHWEKTKYVPALVASVQTSVYRDGPEKAVDELLGELARAPSSQGFLALVELVMKHRQQLDKSQLLTLYGILRTLVSNEPKFVCSSCGFSVNEHYWRCPSCKSWSSVHAITPSKTELRL